MSLQFWYILDNLFCINLDRGIRLNFTEYVSVCTNVSVHLCKGKWGIESFVFVNYQNHKVHVSITPVLTGEQFWFLWNEEW